MCGVCIYICMYRVVFYRAEEVVRDSYIYLYTIHIYTYVCVYK